MSCDTREGREKLSPIKMVRAKHGGHLGFMYHQADKTVDEEIKISTEDVSFMPAELARFLEHTYERRDKLDKVIQATDASPIRKIER